MVGDLHTAALISTEGSIDWLCLPRFDSPACFNALLDTPKSGRWLLAPAGGGECTRRHYRKGTLILETEWETPTGKVKVIDFMPPARRGRGHRADRGGGPRCRPDARRTGPAVRLRPHRPLGPPRRARHPCHRRTRCRLPRDRSAAARRTACRPSATSPSSAGERVPFVLTWTPSHLYRPRTVDPEAVLASTETFWQDWSAKCTITGPYREAVQRSLITLKALTYDPTGGIVAAVTTSLPEDSWAATRNWDYRFCWLRDATLTLQALLAAGYTEEAASWRDWLLRAVAGDPADLQIMYGIHGERRLPEMELPWLRGYEKLRSGADRQRRRRAAAAGCLGRGPGLPVPDEELAAEAHRRILGRPGGADGAPGERLDRPDNGLWEMRGPRRHFTHSKVMAWVAADRMVKGVRDFGLAGPADRWEELRDTIHAEVMAKGFDAERNTFVQSYGRPELDASLLLIPRVGFLPPDDPRVIGTIEAVQRELTHDGFLLRYRPAESDDGLPGRGGRVPCLFVLAGRSPPRGGPAPRGQGAVRTAAGAAQRRRSPQRGMERRRRPAAGEHPAGVQPLRAGPECPGTA